MFEDFWNRYPRKVAKQAAFKAWAKMSQIARQAALDALGAHIKYWSTRDSQFIPHAATWLNGERWEDEILVEKTLSELALEEYQKTHGGIQ